MHVAFVAVWAFSLYVLFWPSPAGGGGPYGADKVVHVLLFLSLAGTARLRLGARWPVLAGVLVYAGASELVQALALAERSGDRLDLFADTAGALAGWALARRWAS